MMDDQSTDDRALTETGRDGRQGSAAAPPAAEDPEAAAEIEEIAHRLAAS